MLGLLGCDKAKYKIDYSGQKDFLNGAKDAYKAGEKVEFSFDFIATDTNYYFYLDGEPYNPTYDDKRGFVISFIMPEHDVKFEIDSKNTMIYDPSME